MLDIVGHLLGVGGQAETYTEGEEGEVSLLPTAAPLFGSHVYFFF